MIDLDVSVRNIRSRRSSLLFPISYRRAARPMAPG